VVLTKGKVRQAVTVKMQLLLQGKATQVLTVKMRLLLVPLTANQEDKPTQLLTKGKEVAKVATVRDTDGANVMVVEEPENKVANDSEMAVNITKVVVNIKTVDGLKVIKLH